MTVKSSASVGYLNAILAQGGGNLNKSTFESSNARGIAPGGGGGGMLMFRIDRRITQTNVSRYVDSNELILCETATAVAFCSVMSRKYISVIGLKSSRKSL